MMLGSNETIIDIFTHFLPKKYIQTLIDLDGASHLVPLVERFARIDALCEAHARLDLIAEFGALQQVLSMALPTPELVRNEKQSATLARVANDSLAELVSGHKDKFPAFLASLPMADVPAALQEMDRAVSDLGAKGFQILTSIDGMPLDAPKFFAIFERAASLGVPIFLHPYRTDRVSDYASEQVSEFEISNILGWPHETSVAMARLVFSEVLTKLPNLKVVAHHLGGTVPYLAGRVGPMWDQLGLRSGNAKHVEIRERLNSPIRHFRKFFADTAVADVAALRCGLAFFGVDHVLFASDAPFGPGGGRVFIAKNLEALNSAGLSPDDRRKISATNARALLSL
jgi:aminocarboxymuconate-semialdehyde decarboxylase